MKILTHKSCIVSAKLLRDNLSKLLNEKILVTTDSTRIRKENFIRYGNSDAVNTKDSQFNCADFIALVSNKSAFSELMSKNDIYSPIYYQKTQPKDFPVIIRKSLNTSGGRGIVVCPDKKTFEDNWQPNYVWTPFVKTQFELRVHVIDGKIIKIFKKRFVGEGKPENGEEIKENELPIRNLAAGYHFALREIGKYGKVTELVEKLSKILTGKFYTLDIGWDAKEKKYFVYEANSGSGLNTQTVELYAQYFASVLKK